jgi:uncharacterized Ntn-hydrolase superfamily protein
MQLNTFSISARCAETGMLGVAVSTAVPGVGGICPFVRPGVGAVSTQAWVNPYLGHDAIGLLARGKSAEETVNSLIEADPGRAVRQLGVVDARGRSCAWTGEDCVDWAGQRTGPDVSVQGNMLMGGETIEAMFEAFAATAGTELPERLVRVLEAGQAAGGDKRGKQSAAVLVYDKELYPYLDLRVDEHYDPVGELRRVFEIAKKQYLPFVVGMPTRENPLGALGEEVTEMLLRGPAERPGGTLSSG